METSANLRLPYIMPSQAQKHVTHNEAIRSLDSLVHLAVLDRDLAEPPASPAEGDRYLVAPAATGEWEGQDHRIAAWQDGAWAFFSPGMGWLIWLGDESRLIAHDGTSFRDAVASNLNPADLVGINATAHSSSRLVVRSPSILFDEEDGDFRLHLNKDEPGDTSSLIFQTGYSGRAELGLMEDDNWHLKVSSDGTTWTEALEIEKETGRVKLPAALPLGEANQVVALRHIREKLVADRTYYVRTDGSDSNDGLSDTSGGAFLTMQKAMDVIAGTLDLAGYTVTVQVGAGIYTSGVEIKACTGLATANHLVFVGDATTPSNVVVNVSTGTAFLAAGTTVMCRIRGFRVSASSGISRGIHAYDGAVVNFGAMDFAAFAGTGFHIHCLSGAVATATENYAISGGATRHIQAERGGIVVDIGKTITITDTPTLGRFVQCSSLANVIINGNTFSGSATGTRFNVSLNGVIYTNGGGASYLPGDIDGATATGGQYA